MPQSVSETIRRRIEQFRRKQRRHPQAVRLLAEGDSWFSFGQVMWHSKSLIGKLNEYRTVNLVSVANPGAELRSVVRPDNRCWHLANNPAWLQHETYDALLFSGGGNDIVGRELSRYLHPKTSTRFGAQLIREDVLTDQLDRMADEFRQLRRTVDARVRSSTGAMVPIIAHGYDYAHPSGSGTALLGGLVTIGPWILPGLLERNIVAVDEQVEIVNTLVDRFNELLHWLQHDSAAGIAAFHHADLRGVLHREDWSDELHPGAAGRDKLAARLRQQIVSIVVS